MNNCRNTVLGLGFIFFIALFSSCTESVKKQLTAVPMAYGIPNRVNPVMDQELWEGALGDTFEFHFSSTYLMLPQPESIFDLEHFTPQQIRSKSERKKFSSYIILANLENKESETTKMVMKDLGEEKLLAAKNGRGYNVTVGRDKWAKGQTVIYMYGYGWDKLVENIQVNAPQIINKIYDSQAGLLKKSVYVTGRSPGIEANIRGKFGIDMQIPKTFVTAMNEAKDFMWIRDDDVKGYVKNILLHKVKYTDKSQLTREGLKAIRNKLGKYVTSHVENSYMVINDVDLPMFVEVITQKGKFALEAKGVWELG